jgi:hypothetical protein
MMQGKLQRLKGRFWAAFVLSFFVASLAGAFSGSATEAPTIPKPDSFNISDVKKMALGGDVQAQLMMAGYYYQMKNPTKEDSVQMIYWYERAARNSSIVKYGDFGAHEQLAFFYCGELCQPTPYRIKKVDKPDFKAFAEETSATLKRHNIDQDLVKAYLHYTLANRAPKRDIYDAEIDVLKAKMWKQEIKKAEQLADLWQTNPQGN